MHGKKEKLMQIYFNFELVPESFNSPKGIIVNTCSPVATLTVNPGLHKQK